MGALPSGTVTFLFTDVEGSTRLLQELGAEGYAAALQEHRRVVRQACAAHGGVEVDTQGDAFFVAFPTAPGALAAAAELTEGLAGAGEGGAARVGRWWRRAWMVRRYMTRRDSGTGSASTSRVPRVALGTA